MKRRRGEGTVCKRKDGRWEAAAYVNTPQGITRVRRYAKSRTEAESKLVQLRNNNNWGILTSSRESKLGDYLDYWLMVVQPTIRRDTFKGYESIVRIYLKPNLGQKRLAKLSVADVQLFINNQLAIGKSVRTVQKMKIVLSTCLQRAMHEELLIRNAARLVDMPTYKPEEKTPWTPAQLSEFLDVATEHPYYPIFVMPSIYGLRRNEVLGLSWSDIDFDNKVVHIRKQLSYDQKTCSYSDLKTQASRRDLPLQDIVAEILANVIRTNAGPLPDLIFKTKSGLPVDGHNLRRSFIRLTNEAGLPQIALHTLRHTAATNLKNLGIAARDAQAILGHPNITTTLQIYQHSDFAEKSKALSQYESQIVDIRACSRQIKPSSDIIEQEISVNNFGRSRLIQATNPRLMSPAL